MDAGKPDPWSPKLPAEAAEQASLVPSPNTARARNSDWRLWLDHLRRTPDAGPPLPASPADVAAFAARLAKRGRSPASVRRAVSTIGAVHRMLGMEAPGASQEVRATLSGLGRPDQAQAAPIQWTDVEAFLHLKPPDIPARPGSLRSDAAWLRARAMLATAHSTLARRAELVGIDGIHVALAGETGRVRLARIKGGGSDDRHLSAPAARALGEWMELCGGPKGAVFVKIGPTGRPVPGARLAPSAVPAVFRATMAATGRRSADLALISGHSCRIGAAIDLQEHGASLPEIMDAGGWRSPSMPARYTRQARADRSGMARMMARIAAPAPIAPVHPPSPPPPRPLAAGRPAGAVASPPAEAALAAQRIHSVAQARAPDQGWRGLLGDRDSAIANAVAAAAAFGRVAEMLDRSNTADAGSYEADVMVRLADALEGYLTPSASPLDELAMDCSAVARTGTDGSGS